MSLALFGGNWVGRERMFTSRQIPPYPPRDEIPGPARASLESSQLGTHAPRHLAISSEYLINSAS